MNLTDLDAHDLSRAIHARQLSCREVMQAYLARIHELNPRANALVNLAPDERLLQQADERDAQLARGESMGWLHGIPQAIKDTGQAIGFPTTFGTPLLARSTAAVDSLYVQRMKAAGCIVVGKTNMPEFGLGSNTYNPLFGVTPNAWDESVTCGGSSGGAAVALACGMHAIADGSDMGGSLRNPAGYCNVVGLRPAPGRVPDWPSQNLWQPLSVLGPMARTAGDVALALSAIAGPDPRAPLSISEPGAQFAQPLDRDFRGVRVAWSRDLGGLPVDPQVTAALDAQRAAFEALGCAVEEATPDFSGADEVFKVFRALSYELGLGELLDQHRDQLKDTVIWNIEAGRALTGPQLAAAERARGALFERMHAFFERYEFLICPVSQLPPFDLSQPYIKEINGVALETYIDWMRSCYYISATAHPAISVPGGFTPGGLPVGIQIVGRHRDELGLLQLAHAFEGASGFWQQHPALAQ